ncbi:MAG: SpoIIE family protein phosphatase [Campylobacterales bacterium]|nr:SpoIIE family protein phosphatase [Campylobacterales bacterium]
MKNIKLVHKNKSLSKTLSLILIIGVCIVSSLATAFLYSINKTNALEDFEKRNKAIKYQLSISLSEPMWNIDGKGINVIASSYTNDISLVSLDVFSEDMRKFYSYKNPIAGNKKYFHKDSIAIRKNKEYLGIIEIVFSKENLNNKLNKMLINSLLVLILTLITISALTLISFRLLLNKSLDNLMNRASLIGSGDISSDANNLFKEFMPLIEVLNTMSSKISRQVSLLNENKNNLEITVKERTSQLLKEKQFIHSIMNSLTSMVLTTDGKEINSINQAFLDYFNLKDEKDFFRHFKNEFSNYENNESILYLMTCIHKEEWLNRINDNPDNIHKVEFHMNNCKYIFTITIDKFIFENKELFTIVLTDISELEKIKNKIEEINKHTKESIEYAALIQNSLIPSIDLINEFFTDSFVIWEPKDIVGGDIYLFPKLINKDECILMMIDCTGHGVPGAFVTMLVKAIEKQIITITNANEEDINPAYILQEFNKEMKSILKQNASDMKFNAGFDGAIISYNKKDKILKYAGAKVPLYYIINDEINTIKGDSHSIGYNTSDINYKFTQHEIKIEEDMTFYLSTDGFLDQTGGLKGFSYGRKKFKELLLNNYKKSMNEQQDIYLSTLNDYQGNEEKNDDITFIALKP